MLEPYRSAKFTKKDRAYRFRVVGSAVPLREAHLSNLNDGNGFLGVAAWNSFVLQWGQGNSHSFYLFCKTPEEKKQIYQAIEEAITTCKQYN